MTYEARQTLWLLVKFEAFITCENEATTSKISLLSQLQA